jgi:hypothetical protein
MKEIRALTLLLVFMGSAPGCGGSNNGLTPEQACSGVLYYNSAVFTDPSGNVVDTKPAVFAELDAIARSITLK